MGKSCVSSQNDDFDDLNQRQSNLDPIDPYKELREKEALGIKEKRAKDKESRIWTSSEQNILDLGLGEIELSVDQAACDAWTELFGNELRPEDVLKSVVKGVKNIDCKDNTYFQIMKCGGGGVMTLNCKRSDDDCIEKNIPENDRWHRENCQMVVSRLITRTNDEEIRIVEERTGVHAPGACKLLYQCMLPIYQQMGARTVTLDADEVGSYAWLRYGFRPKQDGEKSWSKLCGKIASTLNNLEMQGDVTKEEADQLRELLKNPDPNTIVQISGLKKKFEIDGREVTLGFRLLQKNIWEGVLDLEDEGIMQEVWTYITQ